MTFLMSLTLFSIYTQKNTMESSEKTFQIHKGVKFGHGVTTPSVVVYLLIDKGSIASSKRTTKHIYAGLTN